MKKIMVSLLLLTFFNCSAQTKELRDEKWHTIDVNSILKLAVTVDSLEQAIGELSQDNWNLNLQLIVMGIRIDILQRELDSLEKSPRFVPEVIGVMTTVSKDSVGKLHYTEIPIH